jgi:DNA-directed RNA polymerase subunit RPC12/RpoP
MAAITGKRYRCPSCGAEFIVTRGADEGELRCGDEPLEQL